MYVIVLIIFFVLNLHYNYIHNFDTLLGDKRVDLITMESWRKLSKEDLETEYSPSKWSKRYSAEEIITAHVEFSVEKCAEVRKNVPCRLNVQYGEAERAKLDVFGEDLPGESVIFVYVHGGYWQEMSKEYSCFAADNFYNNRIVSVIVGYTLAPQATVLEIIAEIKKAVDWACDLASVRKSRGVVLAGWSAGGHLVTEVLSTIKKEETPNYDFIKGVITLSGVFDLRPLVHTYVNDPLHLDENTAWSISPSHKTQKMAKNFPSLKALVVVGENESAEFKRQSENYSQALSNDGINSTYEIIENVDHFDLMEKLIAEDYELFVEILKFVNFS